MAEFSAITWTDHTFNPWMGCTKVGPGCDNCYAERDMDHRYGKVKWGAGQERIRTQPANWNKVRRWNREAEAFRMLHGHNPRVFVASLADVFDNEVDPAWREDLWNLMRETPNLEWLIVTKRIGNVRKMVPADWPQAFPHAILIITVCTQEEADRDIPKLMATPARHRGLSVEPMLGPMTLPAGCSDLDWVICGGESGPAARIMAIEWARDLKKQCDDVGIAFHMKQLGKVASDAGERVTYAHRAGADAEEWPADLRVRDFPAIGALA